MLPSPCIFPCLCMFPCLVQIIIITFSFSIPLFPLHSTASKACHVMHINYSYIKAKTLKQTHLLLFQINLYGLYWALQKELAKTRLLSLLPIIHALPTAINIMWVHNKEAGDRRMELYPPRTKKDCIQCYNGWYQFCWMLHYPSGHASGLVSIFVKIMLAFL